MADTPTKLDLAKMVMGKANVAAAPPVVEEAVVEPAVDTIPPLLSAKAASEPVAPLPPAVDLQSLVPNLVPEGARSGPPIPSYAPPQQVVFEPEPQPIIEQQPLQPMPDIGSAAAGTEKLLVDLQAFDKANKALNSFQEQQERKRQELEANLAKMDDEVRAQSLPEIMQKGSFGQKLLAAFSLALGGISQGLTGAKSNPVMDFINAQVEQQAAKDRLSLAKKESLRKQLLDEGKLRLEQLQESTSNAAKKANIQVQIAELEQRSAQAAAKAASMVSSGQQNDKLGSGLALSDAEYKALPLKQKAQTAQLPDGRRVFFTDKKDKTNFVKALTDLRPARESAMQLKKLAEKVSLVDKVFPTALSDRIKDTTSSLIGQLRLPYTGPGVLTEREKDELRGVLGNPLAFTSWAGRAPGRLDRLQREMEARMQYAAEVNGVNEQLFPGKRYQVRASDGSMVVKSEADLIKAYKQNPNYANLSDEFVADVLSKNFKPVGK